MTTPTCPKRPRILPIGLLAAALSLLTACVTKRAPYEFHLYSDSPFDVEVTPGNPWTPGPIQIPFIESDPRAATREGASQQGSPVQSCSVWAQKEGDKVWVHFDCGLGWVFENLNATDPTEHWVITIEGFDDGSANVLPASATGLLSGAPTTYAQDVTAAAPYTNKPNARLDPNGINQWVLRVNYLNRSISCDLKYTP